MPCHSTLRSAPFTDGDGTSGRRRDTSSVSTPHGKHRDRLLALEAELSHRCADRSAITVIEPAGDDLERALETSRREQASQQHSQISERLNQVRVALRRIYDGAYDECEACDGEIPERRHEAAPWATLCVPCQEAEERRERL